MGIEHDWQARLAAAGLAAPTLPGHEASFDIWRQLIRHQLEVMHSFASEEREHLILRERQNGPPPLSGRNLDILERFLCGVGRKVISYEFKLSQSAIAQLLKAALVDMGLDCSPARAPSLLVVLAQAARGTRMHSELNIGEFELENARYRVLSVSFGEPVLTRLAPAERAVVCQLIGGSSYGDIAARRQTSYRTVANQVAAACHRLGVSGRFDLLQLVAAFAHPRTGEQRVRSGL